MYLQENSVGVSTQVQETQERGSVCLGAGPSGMGVSSGTGEGRMEAVAWDCETGLGVREAL